MRQKISLRPVVMGGLMGLMMLWMLHGMLTGDGGLHGAALVGFIAAHVVVAVIAVAATVFAARLHPRVRSALARLHRPSWRHMRDMGLGVLVAAGIAHIALHGGF